MRKLLFALTVVTIISSGSAAGQAIETPVFHYDVFSLGVGFGSTDLDADFGAIEFMLSGVHVTLATVKKAGIGVGVAGVFATTSRSWQSEMPGDRFRACVVAIAPISMKLRGDAYFNFIPGWNITAHRPTFLVGVSMGSR